MISIGYNSKRSVPILRRGVGQRGITLVELLVTIVMSTMVFLSLSMLLSTVQAVRGSGEDQSEAQRDASLVLQTLARAGRQSTGYTISLNGAKVTFTSGACSPSFQGGPTIGPGGGQVQMSDGCPSPTTTLLIDGARSRATQFQMTSVSPNKVVHARIQITYRGQQNELLETDLFLRNGT